ncbi:hypothetical protein GYMLUDRAFT_35737 [Collybiopsis luxurians FD-317 M1]|nr:hypothetical protein GYMLUDRAFT_35737 [Collybiopsis luxurians FD-317 M1]
MGERLYYFSATSRGLRELGLRRGKCIKFSRKERGILKYRFQSGEHPEPFIVAILYSPAIQLPSKYLPRRIAGYSRTVLSKVGI